MLASASTLTPKIFYIQLSDAARMDPPLSPTHPFYDESMPWHMQWSRNARLFPCEPELGGYLPIGQIVQMWLEEMGWRGWVSMELFNRSMGDKDGEEVGGLSGDHAERGVRSWKTLRKELGYLDGE